MREKKKNYRLVTFMNIDLKGLTKMQAHKIQPNVKVIMYHDKVGFIPPGESRFNIQVRNKRRMSDLINCT